MSSAGNRRSWRISRLPHGSTWKLSCGSRAYRSVGSAPEFQPTGSTYWVSRSSMSFNIPTWSICSILRGFRSFPQTGGIKTRSSSQAARVPLIPDRCRISSMLSLWVTVRPYRGRWRHRFSMPRAGACRAGDRHQRVVVGGKDLLDVPRSHAMPLGGQAIASHQSTRNARQTIGATAVPAFVRRTAPE